ncbi:MAG: polysaccharide deacetylase family protein [Chloroflexota bacterium]
MKTKLPLLFLTLSLLLSGCNGFTTSTPTPTSHPLEVVPSLPPTETATVTPTFTPTPTLTPQPTPTSTRVAQGPGLVTVPILLYHHIQATDYFSRYRVPPERFEQQMKLLHDWGYETITTELLVKAITEGADLPPRPILITFDDGDVDVYENAFPIMEKYGFKGVFYLVSNFVGQPNYISVEQVQEMAAAGWEIGSHSMNHTDLVQVPDNQRAEIVESKEQLESLLGVPVKTFAYPFGKAGSATVDYVRFAGYIAAMGLGYTTEQGKGNLFFLQRWEVQSNFDIKAFIGYLPWDGDPAFIPTDVPLATPVPGVTPTESGTLIP